METTRYNLLVLFAYITTPGRTHMMKKSYTCLILILLMTMLGAPFTMAAADDHKEPDIVENGKIVNGKTMIPIRIVSSRFGFQVDWRQESKAVIIRDDITRIELQLSTPKAKVNEREVPLDVPAQIIQGVTYVPLKFLGDAFGANVSWSSPFKAAHVIYADTDLLIYTTIPPVPKLTEGQIRIFSDMANQAAVITNASDAKKLYKPYFTSEMLGNIIWYKGLPFKTEFNSASHGSVEYGDMYRSTATVSQLAHFDSLVWVSRAMEFRYVDHGWKVSRIDFKYVYF